MAQTKPSNINYAVYQFKNISVICVTKKDNLEF